MLLCYGGGFGVMPSFVLNTFGNRLMPVMYGCVLTAWSAARVVGPQAIARLKDHYGIRAAAYAFGLGAGLLALGFCLAWLLHPPERGQPQKCNHPYETRPNATSTPSRNPVWKLLIGRIVTLKACPLKTLKEFNGFPLA